MQNDISFDYYDLLKDPLDGTLLKGLAKQAGVKVADLINTRSQVYKKLGLDVRNMSEEEAIDHMKSNPRIIKRPIFVNQDTVLFGFKEEEYRANLLD